MQRKSVRAQLDGLKNRRLNTVAFGIICSEMVFTWKQQKKVTRTQGGLFSNGTTTTEDISGPSGEEVRQRVQKLVKYECIRQIHSKMEAEKRMSEKRMASLPQLVDVSDRSQA